MTFLQLFCLFLVVTPLCAAPAASPAPAPSLRPVASLALVKRDTEGLSPSRFTCDKSGIYADQDTGCQVRLYLLDKLEAEIQIHKSVQSPIKLYLINDECVLFCINRTVDKSNNYGR